MKPCKATMHIGPRGHIVGCELVGGHAGLHLSTSNGFVSQWRPFVPDAEMTEQCNLATALFEAITNFSEGTIPALDAWRIAIDASNAAHAAIEAEAK